MDGEAEGVVVGIDVSGVVRAARGVKWLGGREGGLMALSRRTMRAVIALRPLASGW